MTYLTPADEQRLSEIREALDAIEAQAAPYKAERKNILTKARVRKHRAKQVA